MTATIATIAMRAPANSAARSRLTNAECRAADLNARALRAASWARSSTACSSQPPSFGSSNVINFPLFNESRVYNRGGVTRKC